MTWLDGLTSTEIREMQQDLCDAYEANRINEIEFRSSLGKLRLNATDIEELVKFHRPPAPENDNDYSGG